MLITVGIIADVVATILFRWVFRLSVYTFVVGCRASDVPLRLVIAVRVYLIAITTGFLALILALWHVVGSILIPSLLIPIWVLSSAGLFALHNRSFRGRPEDDAGQFNEDSQLDISFANAQTECLWSLRARDCPCFQLVVSVLRNGVPVASFMIPDDPYAAIAVKGVDAASIVLVIDERSTCLYRVVGCEVEMSGSLDPRKFRVAGDKDTVVDLGVVATWVSNRDAFLLLLTPSPRLVGSPGGL